MKSVQCSSPAAQCTKVLWKSSSLIYFYYKLTGIRYRWRSAVVIRSITLLMFPYSKVAPTTTGWAYCIVSSWTWNTGWTRKLSKQVQCFRFHFDKIMNFIELKPRAIVIYNGIKFDPCLFTSKSWGTMQEAQPSGPRTSLQTSLVSVSVRVKVIVSVRPRVTLTLRSGRPGSGFLGLGLVLGLG